MHPLLLVLAVLSAPAAPPTPPAEITGAVSPLLPRLCRPMEPPADGGDVLRCAGLVGADVFLRGPEAARQVALLRPEGFLPAPPDGARLGQSVAWRLLGDRPIAAVLRYRFPEAAEAPADVIVVLKPARDGAPGCVVGAVEEGAGPSATAPERAAALADRRAPLFRCGRDRPTLDGPWSPAGRARIGVWFRLVGG
ncbi:hypothetical protein D3218_12010 [Aureimonas flava]|uniref:TonB C-terminal domain-containing protein n=1 Tax=Aureimonas flava TaxID=2320271 RepID=A0A3A1WJG7_9HYPH|nr:hypothetical protein [Aureimonas flava]RIY00019.1 hypothetical protein D3218_12010 [Aureimonas flava]